MQFVLRDNPMIPEGYLLPATPPNPRVRYHGIQMRRWLSICLILFFGLGPLTALSQASDESRLPPCCRRHGAHHCAMSDALLARMLQASDGAPAFSAPAHCPYFPQSRAATLAKASALLTASPATSALLALRYTPAAASRPAGAGLLRTHAGRGPPRSVSV